MAKVTQLPKASSFTWKKDCVHLYEQCTEEKTKKTVI